MQDFSGIERTTVAYSTWVSSTVENSTGGTTTGLMLGSRGVCSDNGTTVTVTFESVSIEVSRLDRLGVHINTYLSLLNDGFDEPLNKHEPRFFGIVASF